jgi:hypothetical protein
MHMQAHQGIINPQTILGRVQSMKILMIFLCTRLVHISCPKKSWSSHINLLSTSIFTERRILYHINLLAHLLLSVIA